MIFVTVGNHYQGFDRLIKKVDEIASAYPSRYPNPEGLFSILPSQVPNILILFPSKTAMEYIRTSELVISHAGIGTIILCREHGIPLILLPRRKKYGEHGTDHQVEIVKAIEERRDDYIFVVYEEDQLEGKIAEVLTIKQKPVPRVNMGRASLINTIRAFIQEGER